MRLPASAGISRRQIEYFPLKFEPVILPVPPFYGFHSIVIDYHARNRAKAMCSPSAVVSSPMTLKRGGVAGCLPTVTPQIGRSFEECAKARPSKPTAPERATVIQRIKVLELVDLPDGVCDVAQHVQPFCAPANLIRYLGRPMTKWFSAWPSTLERQLNTSIVAADRRQGLGELAHGCPYNIGDHGGFDDARLREIRMRSPARAVLVIAATVNVPTVQSCDCPAICLGRPELFFQPPRCPAWVETSAPCLAS